MGIKLDIDIDKLLRRKYKVRALALCSWCLDVRTCLLCAARQGSRNEPTLCIVCCLLSLRYLLSQINDWFGAAKKTLLSNANKLLQDMQEFDKDNIPDKVIAVRRQDNQHAHNDETNFQP